MLSTNTNKFKSCIFLCCSIMMNAVYADVLPSIVHSHINSNKHSKREINSFEELVNNAKYYSRVDKHKKSIKLYRQALQINPNAYELYLPLAWQLLWDKQFGQAKDYFNRHLKIDQNNLSAKRGIIEANNPALVDARVFSKKKQYIKSSELLKELTHINDVPTLLEMAVVAGVANDHKLSIKFYQKALAIDPKFENKILLPYAWQLLWNNQFKKSASMFKQYLKIRPHDKKAKLGLLEATHPKLTTAHIFVRKRKFEPAISIYKNVLTKEPNNATVLTWLGRAYAHNDDHSLAAKTYKNVFRLSHDPSLYLPIAQQSLWSYQAEEAYKYFKLAKKHNKKKPELIYSGLLESKQMIKDQKLFHLKNLLSSNHLVEARAYSKNLMRLDPKNDAWLADIASIFSELGYHEDSNEFYKMAMDINSIATEYLYMASVAWNYLWIEEFNESCRMFHILYTKGLIGDNVLDGTGFCLQKQFGSETAIDYYQQLVKRFSWKEKLWKLRIGQIYIEDNQYKIAREHLLKLLDVLPLDTKIIDSVGSTYNFSDQNIKALKHYRYYTDKMTWNNKLNLELAQTYYWLGLNKTAHNTLAANIPFKTQPEHALLDVIDRNASNRLYIYTNYSDDSNGLDISGTSFELQHFVNDRTSIAPIFSFGYAQETTNRTWQSLGVELQTRYGDADSRYGIVWPSVSVGIGHYGNWNPFLMNSKVLWRVNDHFTNSFRIGNQVILGSSAIGNRITYTSVSNEMHFSDMNWRSHLLLEAGRFRDNNKRYLIDFDWLYRVYPLYYLYLGPAFIYYHNTSDELNNGYYNPKHYAEISLYTKATFNLREFYISPYFKFGDYFAEDPQSNTHFTFVSGIRVTRDIKQYHHLTFNIAYFSSGSNSFQGGENYQQFVIEAGYHYYF